MRTADDWEITVRTPIVRPPDYRSASQTVTVGRERWGNLFLLLKLSGRLAEAEADSTIHYRVTAVTPAG